VGNEQPYPRRHAVGNRPVQLAADQLGRRVHGIAEALAPWPAVAGPEAELEQELQVVIARLEHPVVERLGVVRIGTSLEQDTGEGE
jgi:hypothetical protein